MSQAVAFRNARVLTMASARPTASALAIRDGSIRKVGDWEDVQSLVSGPVYDLAGLTVIPGFVDSHTHPSYLGLDLLSEGLSEAQSIDEVLEAVRRRAAATPPGNMVMAAGLHPPQLRERRDPTLAELDAVVPDHPAVVRNRGGHYMMVNSAALRRANIPAAMPGVVRDANGMPTGRLVAEALRYILRVLVGPWMTETGRARIMQTVAEQAAARGITTLHALDGGRTWVPPEARLAAGLPPAVDGGEEDPDVLALLAAKVPVDLVVYYQTTRVEAAQKLGLPRIGGCVLVDGGHEARTAAFLEPYADNPQNEGTLYFTQEDLDEFIWQAHTRGLQVAVHAIGSAAIEQALNAYERALTRLPRRDHRHRIEHFEHPVPGQTERAARLGVAVGIQPSFNHYWPHPHFIASLGPERAARANPMRSLIRAGIRLGGGSDAPVTPLEPFLGIQSAVTYSRPEERLSVEEALRLFTLDAAGLAFEEKRKGSLEEGKQADLVVLDRNPLEVPPEELREIQVVMTVHRGEVVYRR